MGATAYNITFSAPNPTQDERDKGVVVTVCYPDKAVHLWVRSVDEKNYHAYVQSPAHS
jgi:hypothetical protein